ncbi:MAG: hypothetical protein WCL59_12495, partial [Cyanobium sp. ELA507]
IDLYAGQNIAQNGAISSSGGTINASAQQGTLVMGSSATTQSGGGAIVYQSTGSVTLARLDAGAGKVSVVTQGTIASAGGYTGTNIQAGSAALTAASATLSTQVDTLQASISGSYTITDPKLGTLSGTTSTGGTQEKLSCLLDPTQCTTLGGGTGGTGTPPPNETTQTALETVNLTQQQVVDTATVRSVKPEDLMSSGSSGPGGGGVSSSPAPTPTPTSTASSSDSSTQGSAQPSGEPDKDAAKKDEKKDEKKDDKKDESDKKDQGAKKDEPAKKMYCN